MQPKMVILTGDPGSGKTTTCRQFADRVQQRGLDCAGIVCPARFDGARKVGVDLLNVRTNELRPLAEVDDRPAALRTGKYRFDTEAIAWGRACLDTACPCDVFIVDEVGPLELERGQGWANALDILRARKFGLAVAVVRPRLVDTFRAVMGDITMEMVSLPHSQPDGDPVDDILGLL
jgi:nucleoside-triphosphatase THEP1